MTDCDKVLFEVREKELNKGLITIICLHFTVFFKFSHEMFRNKIIEHTDTNIHTTIAVITNEFF